MAIVLGFWLTMILTFIGALYLFVVLGLAFKERLMIASITILMVFIFIVTFAFRQDLIYRYALSGARVAAGQAYTMITYMFLHANPAHIFLNALGLLFFGYHIEKEFGGPPTILIFLVSGLVGGAAFVMTSPSTALVVGASGGVFGLMAYLTLIRPFKISPMPFLIPMPVALAAAIYTVVTIPMVLSGTMGDIIAHNAHIGGMIGGAAMAFGMNRQQALKGLVLFVVLLLLVIAVPIVFF